MVRFECSTCGKGEKATPVIQPKSTHEKCKMKASPFNARIRLPPKLPRRDEAQHQNEPSFSMPTCSKSFTEYRRGVLKSGFSLLADNILETQEQKIIYLNNITHFQQFHHCHLLLTYTIDAYTMLLIIAGLLVRVVSTEVIA